MGTEDEDRKGAGARDVGSLNDRSRYRLDEPQDPGAAPVEATLKEPLVPFAALLLAMQRQDELRALTRQRAALVASFGCESRPPAPHDEWRRLWDDMERDAAAPKVGYEPSDEPSDQESLLNRAPPEIEEWERHWPSELPIRGEINPRSCGCECAEATEAMARGHGGAVATMSRLFRRLMELMSGRG